MNTTPSKVSLGNGKPDYATATALLSSRIHNAGVPFAAASASSLQVIGTAPFWTSVSLSLDAKAEWRGGYLQNSRYARFAVTVEGPFVEGVGGKFVVECISGGSTRDFPNKAFRKFRAKTLEEVADKIANWALLNNLPAAEAAKRIAA